MTDHPPGPLAAVRAAIEQRIEAQYRGDQESSVSHEASDERISAQTTLDAALAEVEAQHGRLARFVRAWDVTARPSVVFADDRALDAALRELRAARAALTEEDVT